MKKFYMAVMLFYLVLNVSAQSWNITGNTGLTTNNFLGTKDWKDLIFKVNNIERGRLIKSGIWRFGSDTSYASIDSMGKVSFTGSGGYNFKTNKYIFQSETNTKIGLFYNGTGSKFEFRNNNGQSIFSLNTTNGNAIFTGTLKIGKYTLPKTDGGIGQILKTDGAGNLAWANDNGTNYIPGNGIDIDGGVISATNIKTDALLNTSVGVAVSYSNTTGADNTATGFKSLYANTTGNENSAHGFLALSSNTTGFSNAAFGAYSLGSNISGIQNTAIGDGSLYNNTTATGNTATGFGAAYFNQTGSYNTVSGYHALEFNYSGNENMASGYQSLFSNLSGGDNVAIGANALYRSKVGSNLVAVGAYALYNQDTDSTNIYANTALGYKSLFSNTVGNSNTAAGFSSLLNNTSGFYNTAFGAGTLYSNTTGIDNTVSGSYAAFSNTTGLSNTVTGAYSLYQNTTGSSNVVMGHQALYGNTTGSQNVGIGVVSLFNNTTGINNVAVGIDALGNNVTGGYNTAIGAYADVTTSNLTFSSAIGYGAFVDASNKVRIGGTTVGSIGGQVGWTTFSDGRFKKNIQEDVQGLKFINLLKPVTYTVDITSLNTYYNKNRKHDSAYDKMKDAMQPEVNKASVIRHSGFIAQDVEKAATSLHYNFSGVDKPQTEDGLYGLRYSDFVVPLVKAVQQLSKMNDDKDVKIDSLQKQNENLQQQFQELKTIVLKIQQVQQQCNPCSASATNASTQQNASQQYLQVSDAASLEQNVPNPFTNATSIGYYLPQKFSSAKIIITDRNGKALQQLNLIDPGKGIVHVNASTLASGAYNYSLYIDGRLIASKQMVSAK